jgi:glucuronate isomerase
MRNPLYHWTHLELRRYFGISEILNPASAERIYAHCNAALKQKEFSVRGLLGQMNVEVVCTTDDPTDDLRYHKAIAEDKSLKVKVLPTWRPDKTMAIDDKTGYLIYIERLGEAAGMEIGNFADLLTALSLRMKHFAAHGCRVADHGFNDFPDSEFTEAGLEAIFAKALRGGIVTSEEAVGFKSGMIFHLAKMNDSMGWRQQFHIGAIRNNSRRLFKKLGPDIGCDSMADGQVAAGLSRILGMLDDEGCLAPTILYNLNPKDSEVLMSMAYNFNDGSMPGKIQYGAAWWFLDQMEGMRQQLEILSHGGLLSRFVGMLTDSRSFLSFPRHEYFRRILCNELGNDLKRGILPKEEMAFIGKMTADICYDNAKKYFGF